MAYSNSRISGSFIVVIATLGLAVACSGSSKDSDFFGPDSGGSSSGGSSSGGSRSGGSSSGGSSSGGSSSGGSSSGGSSGVADGGDLGDAACVTWSVSAEQKPLDMYIMLDQSGSMNEQVGSGGTKWASITSALTTFVKQPSVSGTGVGLQYFGLGSSPLGADSCTAADYAKPEIEIAPLPGNASAIIGSMGQHSPTTGTPTSAALQGAVDHAKAWETTHADHVTVAVLATDGDPEECDTNLNNIGAIAAAAKNGTPSILTFVIGVGSSLTNLNGIAAAGGTNQAFIVDTSGNANQQFLDALNKIRGAALGCQYKIPPPSGGGTIDYGAVSVEYTPGGGGSPQMLPNVDGKSKCPASGGAWYYDDNASPTEIILCDATCAAVIGDAKASLKIELGCKSK